MGDLTGFCAQHNMVHLTNTSCRNMTLMDEAIKEEEEARLVELADQIAEIHYSTDLGYGDEGEGYDYVEQVRLLIAAGWIPPEKREE